MAVGAAAGYGQGLTNLAGQRERQAAREEERAYQLQMLTLRDKLARTRQDEDREYQKGIRAEEREYQKGIRAEDREYQKGIRAEEREYQKGVREEEREWRSGEADAASERRLAEYRTMKGIDREALKQDPVKWRETINAVKSDLLPSERKMMTTKEVRKPRMTTDVDTGEKKAAVDEQGNPLYDVTTTREPATVPSAAFEPLVDAALQFDSTHRLGSPQHLTEFYRAYTENGENVERFVPVMQEIMAAMGPNFAAKDVMREIRHMGFRIPQSDRDAILGAIEEAQAAAEPPPPDTAIVGEGEVVSSGPSDPNEGLFSDAGNLLRPGDGDAQEQLGRAWTPARETALTGQPPREGSGDSFLAQLLGGGGPPAEEASPTPAEAPPPPPEEPPAAPPVSEPALRLSAPMGQTPPAEEPPQERPPYPYPPGSNVRLSLPSWLGGTSPPERTRSSGETQDVGATGGRALGNAPPAGGFLDQVAPPEEPRVAGSAQDDFVRFEERVLQLGPEVERAVEDIAEGDASARDLQAVGSVFSDYAADLGLALPSDVPAMIRRFADWYMKRRTQTAAAPRALPDSGLGRWALIEDASP